MVVSRDRSANAPPDRNWCRWVRFTYQWRNTVRDLNYQLKKLGRNNRNCSFATQAKRAFLLSQIANQLHDLGYRGMSARS